VAGDGCLPPAVVAAIKEPCPLPKTTFLPLLKVRPWSLGWFNWFCELILRIFFGVTEMASGREMSHGLSLWLWFIAKIQAGGTLDSAVTGIWRFCIRCLSALPTMGTDVTSVDTRQEPREPLLLAFVISLPAILWRSVIMFLMMGCWCWHPEGFGVHWLGPVNLSARPCIWGCARVRKLLQHSQSSAGGSHCLSEQLWSWKCQKHCETPLTLQ